MTHDALVAEATKDDFRELVAEGQVLVDVWGPDCAPCIALRPLVERLAAERAGDLRVIALEAPQARRLCMELRLLGLPAFLLFRDGTEVGRHAGAGVTATSLTEWLDGAMAPTRSERG
ncbi:MAG: thioredoxin family protein [Acidimicrobiales bacterium]